MTSDAQLISEQARLLSVARFALAHAEGRTPADDECVTYALRSICAHEASTAKPKPIGIKGGRTGRRSVSPVA